jgi:hypothetical protein
LPHSLSFHLDNKRAKTRSEQKLPYLFSLLSLSTPSKPKNSSLIFRLDYKQKRPFQFLSLSLLFLSLKKKKEQEKEKNRREKSKDKTRQKKRQSIFLSDDRRLVAARKLAQLARLERDLDDRSQRLLGV